MRAWHEHKAAAAAVSSGEWFVTVSDTQCRQLPSQGRNMTALCGWTTGPENMDAMELDMRMRLAELQLKYREKQRELARLQRRSSSE